MTDTQENIQKEPEKQPEVKEEAPPIKTEENMANWKKFREEREQLRKQAEEEKKQREKAEKEAAAIKAALEAVVSKPVPQQDQYGYPDPSDEEKIQKLVAEAIERDRQKQKEEQAKKEASELPTRLNQEYKDFSKVCTPENLDYLEYHHPEIATSFKYMPDCYDKWANLYKTVKKLVPYSDKAQDEKRIQENAMKPQANVPAITDSSPQTQGWRMTEQRRMDNWRRMQQEIKSQSP